jgi:hypothetical protein
VTPAETAATVVTDVIRHVIDSDPVAAVSLGEASGAGRLPDLTQSGLARRHAAEDVLRRRLENCPAPADPEDACDLACAEAYLAGRAALRPWQPWIRDPGMYLTPLIALNLARRDASEKGAVAAAGVLRALPDFLSASAVNLSPTAMFGPVARRAAAQASAGVALIEALPEAFERPPPALSAAVRAAVAPMTRFADQLKDLAELASGDFRLGHDTFSALISGRDGISTPVNELVARAEQELASCQAELAEGLGKSWRQRLGELASRGPATESDMLSRYADLTARTRQFCGNSGLFEMTDEECEVAPAPPFRRAVLAVASYTPPPVLAAAGGQRPPGVFNVPFVPAGAAAEAVTQRLRSNSAYQLATRTAHETYPGHHWHFSRMRLTGRRAIRVLTRSTAFLEGWATYAEQAMGRAGFFTPEERFGYLEARAFRATRVIVDIGLHASDLAPAEAVAILVSKGNQTAEVAQQELVRYEASPTDSSAYLLGALALDATRSEFISRGGTDRIFNDLVTGLGVPPLTAARARLGLATRPGT